LRSLDDDSAQRGARGFEDAHRVDVGIALAAVPAPMTRRIPPDVFVEEPVTGHIVVDADDRRRTQRRDRT